MPLLVQVGVGVKRFKSSMVSNTTYRNAVRSIPPQYSSFKPKGYLKANVFKKGGPEFSEASRVRFRLQKEKKPHNYKKSQKVYFIVAFNKDQALLKQLYSRNTFLLASLTSLESCLNREGSVC